MIYGARIGADRATCICTTGDGIAVQNECGCDGAVCCNCSGGVGCGICHAAAAVADRGDA